MKKMRPCRYSKIFTSLQESTIQGVSSDTPYTEADALETYILENSDMLEKVYVDDVPFIHFKNGTAYTENIYVCDLRNNMSSLVESSIVCKQRTYKLPVYLKMLGYKYGMDIPETMDECILVESTLVPVEEVKTVKLGRNKYKAMTSTQLKNVGDKLMDNDDQDIARFGETLRDSAEQDFGNIRQYLSNVGLIMFVGGDALSTCLPYIIASIVLMNELVPDSILIPELRNHRNTIRSKLKPKDENLVLYTDFIYSVIRNDVKIVEESYSLPEEFEVLLEANRKRYHENFAKRNGPTNYDDMAADEEEDENDPKNAKKNKANTTKNNNDAKNDEDKQEQPKNEDNNTQPNDDQPTDNNTGENDDQENQEENTEQENQPEEDNTDNTEVDNTQEEPQDTTNDNTTTEEDATEEEDPDLGPTDYTDDATIEEDQPTDDGGGEEDVNTQVDDVGADDVTGDENNNSDSNEDAQQDGNEDGLDDGPTDYDTEAGTDEGGEGDTTDDTATDDTANTEEGGGDDGTGGDTGDTSTTDNADSSGGDSGENERDTAVKNYNIRLKFKKLAESVSDILTNLSTVVYHNPVQNQVLERGIENIQNIKDQVLSYMEFNMSTDYKTNLYYYTTFIQALQLNLDMLTKNNKMDSSKLSNTDTKNNK